MTEIKGSCDARFMAVSDALASNFDRGLDVGASVCVTIDGEPVVDIWGGTIDTDGQTPWERDTITNVWSTTKTMTNLCALLLADHGELDLHAPVARYWPEFAAGGKERIPVRWLLCHKAGLVTVDKKLSAEEVLAWEPIIEALAVQEPQWEPGSGHGYHAVTYGYLVGEVVRRITGKSLGTFFADEVAGPLGLDFWIGLPVQHEHRTAPMIGGIVPPADAQVDPKLAEMLEQFIGPNSLLGRALTVNGAFADPGLFNTRAMHAAEVPAANGITNARSLSRMYAGVVGPVEGSTSGPLLTKTQIEQASARQTEGADKCLFFETSFGLGFFTSSAFAPYAVDGNFGHAGAGGSVGFADPNNQVGFGYVMNKMNQNLSGDPRTTGLIKATYDAIGVKTKYV
jgi:CubicO group peptidase (beta-lactamase class C family)